MNPESGEVDPLIILIFLGLMILALGLPALIAFVEWVQN